jgi:pyruvate formate lyase activating enzyme
LNRWGAGWRLGSEAIGEVEQVERREFLESLCLGTCGVVGGMVLPVEALSGEVVGKRRARHYEKLGNKMVRCLVCPRKCVVPEGQRGYCRVRENTDGEYYTLVYGRVCAGHIDPIEKKPLFHFLPGTTAFSIATVGCNMACKFCQNWEISQVRPEDVYAADLPPEKVADRALQYESPTIAYTYTEPIVWSEYVKDTAIAGHQRGLKSVMISAGYINPDPLAELAAAMDAIKIDLKAFDEGFYHDICGSSLKPVLDTLVQIKESGTWLEIVNLIIPTLNDGEKQIEDLCTWVRANLGPNVPVHFTRFHPTYKLQNLPPTSVDSVARAREIALANGIRFPYVGNVPSGHPGESTYCPACGRRVIHRAGYRVLSFEIEDGRCSSCGAPIPGVWS